MTVDVFYGAAGGSAQKALRVLEEPRVCISAVTKNNRPWAGIEELFIDSGGYSVLDERSSYPTTDAEYLDFLIPLQDRLEYFALRDYPISPEILSRYGRTVEDHQRLTADRHRSLLDLLDDETIDAQPVAVVQGWTLDDYLRHLDDLRDVDDSLLEGRVGIGSLVGRDVDDVRTIVTGVRSALPSSATVHGFGLSREALRYRDVVEALDSADSTAYERRARWATPEAESCDFVEVAYHYLKFKRRIEDDLLVDPSPVAHRQANLSGRWSA